MITKKKNSLVIGAFFIALTTFAQVKLGVYKIDNLLKRIHNNSDTIYVVNFWATWCKPCVQELPEFEKLNIESTHTKSKVKVLLVSLDFKENINDKVLPFLQKNNYHTECIILDEVDGNIFINKINPKWSGAIPATYVTAKNKKKEEFVEKKLHYDDLKLILENF